MKKFFVLMAVALASVDAFAMNYGVEAGFRQQSGTTASGTTAKSQTGYQLGVVANVPLEEKWGLRTGLFYVQRPLKYETAGGLGDAKVGLNYFEVPLAASYRFEEYASIFGGLLLSSNLDSNISGTGVNANDQVQDIKSPIFPLIFGASFMFAPQLGATVFFETAGGNMAKGLSDYRAVGVNLLMTFD